MQLVSAVFWQEGEGWSHGSFTIFYTLPQTFFILLCSGACEFVFILLANPLQTCFCLCISSISSIGNAPTAGLLGTQGAMQAMDKIQTTWNWTNVISFSQVFKHLISNFLMISGSSSVTSNGLVMRDVQTIKGQSSYSVC